MKTVLLLFSCLPFFVSCDEIKTPELSSENIQFKEELMTAIESADQVTFTEYSHEIDYDSPDLAEKRWQAGQIYKTVTLDSVQKLYLRESVRRTHPGFEIETVVITYCFEPHHTVRFTSEGKPDSNLVICFGCNKIKWDGTFRDFPDRLLPILAPVFTEFGFSPRRDWSMAASTPQSEQLSKKPAH